MVMNPVDAVPMFEELDKKFPNNPEVLISLSEVYATVGRHGDARKTAQKGGLYLLRSVVANSSFLVFRREPFGR